MENNTVHNRRYTDLIEELPEETKFAVDSKRLAKRAVTEGVPLNELELRESGKAKDKLLDGARWEVARITNFTIVEKPKTEVGIDNPREVTVEGGAKNEKVLSSEQAERTLGAIKSRFNSNAKLHKGINRKDVEASLKASPEALWSLAQMESAGHAPDVYHDDESGYYFGTCSKESPESGRNCVYDKEAAELVRKNNPNEVFNGSAVEMAKAMGISLMTYEHYSDILQKKGKFDLETRSWLLTRSDVRSTGYALRGSTRLRLLGDYVSALQYRADLHYINGAWRGSLKVHWL